MVNLKINNFSNSSDIFKIEINDNKEETKIEAIFRVAMLTICLIEKVMCYLEDQNAILKTINSKLFLIEEIKTIANKVKPFITEEITNISKKKFDLFEIIEKSYGVEQVITHKDKVQSFINKHQPETLDKMNQRIYEVTGLDNNDYLSFIKDFSEDDIRNNIKNFNDDTQMSQNLQITFNNTNSEISLNIRHSICQIVNIFHLKENNFRFLNFNKIKDFSFQDINKLKISKIYDLVYEKKAFFYDWYIKIEKIKAYIKNIDIKEIENELNTHALRTIDIFKSYLEKRQNLLCKVQKTNELFFYMEKIVQKSKKIA